MHPHSPGLAAAAAPAFDADDRRRLAARLILASHAVRRRAAADVPRRDLDAYLALDWMHRRAGRLAMTGTGQAMLDRALRAFVL